MPGRDAARRTNRDRRDESQEKILDAAEAAFAARGFNGVSVKEIASSANVDASLLHYYFGTKLTLFQAVLARRAPIVNSARLASMKQYAAQNAGRLTVEGVLRAYLAPAYDFARGRDPGRLHYLMLVAQVISSPEGAIPGGESTPFDPVIQTFISLLREASPASSDAELYWFYHMLSGAIGASWAQSGRIDRLSGGICRSDDFDSMFEQMLAVFSRGLG